MTGWWKLAHTVEAIEAVFRGGCVTDFADLAVIDDIIRTFVSVNALISDVALVVADLNLHVAHRLTVVFCLQEIREAPWGEGRRWPGGSFLYCEYFAGRSTLPVVIFERVGIRHLSGGPGETLV